MAHSGLLIDSLEPPGSGFRVARPELRSKIRTLFAYDCERPKVYHLSRWESIAAYPFMITECRRARTELKMTYGKRKKRKIQLHD